VPEPASGRLIICFHPKRKARTARQMTMRGSATDLQIEKFYRNTRSPEEQRSPPAMRCWSAQARRARPGHRSARKCDALWRGIAARRRDIRGRHSAAYGLWVHTADWRSARRSPRTVVGYFGPPSITAILSGYAAKGGRGPFIRTIGLLPKIRFRRPWTMCRMLSRIAERAFIVVRLTGDYAGAGLALVLVARTGEAGPYDAICWSCRDVAGSRLVGRT